MRVARENIAYKSTDLKIIKVLIKSFQKIRPLDIKLREVLSKNGVSPATFYAHYKGLPDLLYKNEDFIHKGIDLEVKKAIINNIPLERFLRNVLLFIYKNNEKYALIIESKNIQMEIGIMEQIRPVIRKGWSDYGEAINDYIYKHVTSSFMAELRTWHDNNYNILELEQRIFNLSRIITMAPKNLAGLAPKPHK